VLRVEATVVIKLMKPLAIAWLVFDEKSPLEFIGDKDFL
jgi:hypothetical protein